MPHPDQAVVTGAFSFIGRYVAKHLLDQGVASEPFVLGQLTLNLAERCVSLAGCPVRLTGMEYPVLAELAASTRRVVNHSDLLPQVWGPAHAGGSGPVRTIVKNLRGKLWEDAENPAYIFNEPRIGYRLGEREMSEGSESQNASQGRG